MKEEALKDYITSKIPEAEFEEENKQFLSVKIPSEKLRKLAEQLWSDDETKFDFLFCLSGVDRVENLQVVYHLRSTEHTHELVLKAVISNRNNPEIETVSDIWQTAEYHEREAYDFYGIKFQNHPDLRRIFLEDDWVGFPMRKDYVDEINIVEL